MGNGGGGAGGAVRIVTSDAVSLGSNRVTANGAGGGAAGSSPARDTRAGLVELAEFRSGGVAHWYDHPSSLHD